MEDIGREHVESALLRSQSSRPEESATEVNSTVVDVNMDPPNVEDCASSEPSESMGEYQVERVVGFRLGRRNSAEVLI